MNMKINNETNQSNNYYEPSVEFQNNTEPVKKKKYVGAIIAAIVSVTFGFIGFILNPFYIFSTIAIVCGAIVIKKQSGVLKAIGILGVIISTCSFLFNFILDIVITVLSLGIGALSFLV